MSNSLAELQQRDYMDNINGSMTDHTSQGLIDDSNRPTFTLFYNNIHCYNKHVYLSMHMLTKSTSSEHVHDLKKACENLGLECFRYQQEVIVGLFEPVQCMYTCLCAASWYFLSVGCHYYRNSCLL